METKKSQRVIEKSPHFVPFHFILIYQHGWYLEIHLAEELKYPSSVIELTFSVNIVISGWGMNGIKNHHEQFYVLGPFQCPGSFDALFNMGLALFQELTIDTYSDPNPNHMPPLSIDSTGSAEATIMPIQQDLQPIRDPSSDVSRNFRKETLEFYTTFMRALGDVAEHWELTGPHHYSPEQRENELRNHADSRHICAIEDK